MQVRKILPLIGLLFLLCCSFLAEAQVVTTNQDGEKIVVYSDGSWAYFDGLDEEERKDILKSSADNKKKKKKKKKNKKDKKNKSKERSEKQKSEYTEAEEELARQEAIQRADWAAMEEMRTKDLKTKAGQELGVLRKQLSAAYSNTDISVKELDELDKKYKNQQAVLNLSLIHI